MSGDPCKELKDRKWGEVVTDQTVRKQLMSCLNREVFELSHVVFFFDEDACMSIGLTYHFFYEPEFYWRGKPSDKRIKDFYEIMKNLQWEFGEDFLLDRSIEPSSTNLNMRIKFPLKRLRRKGIEIEEVSFREILSYLRSLWFDIRNQLAAYGYDFRPSL